MNTDLDDNFNAAPEPAQAQLALSREDVLQHLRWGKPQEVPTIKGQRIKTVARATPEAITLFAREGPDLYALGYTLSEWPRGSGQKHVTKWELVPEKIVIERQAAVEMSRATDATINAPHPEGLDYFPFQRAGIAYAFERRATLLGDQMGLGKTPQACGVLNCMPLARRILVICPASLKLMWRREMTRWLVNRRPILIADSKFFPDCDGVVIINYDILRKHREIIKGTEWDLLIVDECHLLKNPRAIRSQEVLGVEATKKEKATGMADVPGIQATKKLLLTGTPIPNRTREIWGLIHYLDPITWSSWWKFAGRYCGADQSNGWNSDGASNLEELQRRLRETIMIRRLKADVLKELPPKTRRVVAIEPDAEAARIIKAEVEADEEDEAMTDLAARVELAKAGTDAAAYASMVDQLSLRRKSRNDADIFTLRKNTAIAKIRMPVVMDMLEDAVEQSEKVIIFVHHHEVSRTIMAKFGTAAVLIDGDVKLPDRDMAASRFQTDPTCKVIVGSIGAMGTGWTLTAASHVIMLELDFVPGNVSQCEDRAHRIGQTDNVLVEHYVLEGSLDADMARTLVEKQDVIDQALDRQGAEVEARAPVLKGGSGSTFDALATAAAKMTAAQMQASATAIRLLAAACDGAGKIDGQGFNKLDAQIGRHLAAQEQLTPKQCALAMKIAMRYAKTQLPDSLVFAMKGNSPSP